VIGTLFSLQGRVAVVIGGTGELCGAMAGGLAAAGAEVAIAGRDEARARPHLERFAAAGHKAWYHGADATSRRDLEALRDAVLTRSGRIDIVVNGAGANSATPFLDIREDELQRLLDVNFTSVFLGCQVFGGHLVRRGEGGSIINVGSMAGLAPLSRVFTYAAAKAAVHNLSLNLAREWAPHRVRVNVLVPGFFPAEQNRRILDAERTAAILGRTPMQRFGEPRELVGATLLLASDAAGSFITGTELVVDGGFHAASI
jgi:NAD(P)-dependent dehydrogenase (short-subunit alcohol dehydrogenase family)